MDRWTLTALTTSKLAAVLVALLCMQQIGLFDVVFGLLQRDSNTDVATGASKGRTDDNAGPAFNNDDNSWSVVQHLGGYSPWMPKVRGCANESIEPPLGCRVGQVHMISRHGERYPMNDMGLKMLELYRRIQKSEVLLQGDLAFANDWKFFIDSPSKLLETLVSTGPYAGTLQSFTTGAKLRTRYENLLDLALSTGATSFWASDSRRVIDTARYFGAGFYGIDWRVLTTLHVISEGPEVGENTLTPGRTCLNYRREGIEYGRNLGYRMMERFRRTYEPAIVTRLAQQNPDFIFTQDEVFTMQSMCGFELIANGNSRWCDVFTPREWESFEYARDVIHYYRSGPGNPFSATMGWLWLNATAHLLSVGPAAGPLFFSFVHDGDIIPLLTALDIFPQNPHLPVTHVLNNRTWRTSDVVPMGGRIIFERLVCVASQHCWDNGPLYPNHIYCEEPREDVFVRVNVNDGIVPIPGCDSGPGSSCPLDQFLEKVRARGEETGEFGKVCGLSKAAGITFLHQ